MYWREPAANSEHLSMIEAGKCNCQFHPLTFKNRRQKGVQMDDFKSNHHSEISQRHAVEEARMHQIDPIPLSFCLPLSIVHACSPTAQFNLSIQTEVIYLVFLCIWISVFVWFHFTHTHAHTRTHRYVCVTSTCFSGLETVSASNHSKCGQAAAQVNEMATEPLAVFDLPPLIQRDHLIN